MITLCRVSVLYCLENLKTGRSIELNIAFSLELLFEIFPAPVLCEFCGKCVDCVGVLVRCATCYPVLARTRCFDWFLEAV